MSSQNSILHGSIVKTFARFTIPWTFALLMISSAGIIDGLFIGRYVGAMPLAALNLIMPLYSVFIGIATMFASGGAVAVGRYFGKKMPEAASAMFTKTMIVLFIVSIILSSSTIFFADAVAGFLGAKGDVLVQSAAYLKGIMYFGPILCCAMGLSYFIRVDERPMLASAGLVLSAFVNIILDYIFIVELEAGIIGAAFATGIAYTCTLILLSTHFFSKKTKLTFTKKLNNWLEVVKTAWNGASEFINEASSGIVMFIINIIMLREVGIMGVAAFTVVSYSSWFAITLAYGVSDSLAPLVSTNAGARKTKRANAFLKIALSTVIIIDISMFTLFSLNPSMLVNLFVPDNAEVATITLEFMAIYKWAFLFSGTALVMTSYFTGLNRAGHSATVAVSRSLIFPVLFLIVLPVFFGKQGLYAAIPLAELCTFIIASLLFWAGYKYKEVPIGVMVS